MARKNKNESEPLGNIAVLIDFENFNQVDAVAGIYEVLAKRGTVVSKKAVADWSSVTKAVQRALGATGTDLVHQTSTGKGKNSSDVRMVIEAMDLLYDPLTPVDAFVFATSDGDFVPIVTRLRSVGKPVLVTEGPASVATTLEQSADETITVPKTVEVSEPQAEQAAAEKTETPEASDRASKVPAAIRKLILASFDELRESNGDPQVDSSTLIQHIRKQRPDFSHKNHGFKTFRSMLLDVPELDGPRESRQAPYKVWRR